MNIENTMSFADAAKKWGKAGSTIRAARRGGRLKEGVDCWKRGRDWVVSVDAMKRLYGEPLS